MNLTVKPRRSKSAPRNRAHASYSSPGGFTVGMRTRSAASCTISSAARSTSAITRSIRGAFTMRYCSAMKRTAFSLACIAAGTAALTAQAPPRATFGLTAVEGLKVGHHTLAERPTGCTVILVDGDAVGGVSQRGGAPGTRETDLLNPLNMVDKVNAVVLSGGSAFGLDTATGTSKWLEEHHIGWDVRVTRVPIVPAAILFDLPIGNNARNHPGPDCGYKAVESATTAPVTMGTVGAGAGATVGKMGGPGTSMKGGLGSAALRMPNGLVVAAIVAVNAAGDILDP